MLEEILIYTGLAAAAFGLLALIICGYRDHKVFEYLNYLNVLTFLNNILLINIGSKKEFDMDLLPSYDKMVLTFYIPIHKFFKKPDGFKMYSDFTEEDKQILANAKYVTYTFRMRVIQRLREVAYYENKHWGR